jgi:hypothetical protein
MIKAMKYIAKAKSAAYAAIFTLLQTRSTISETLNDFIACPPWVAISVIALNDCECEVRHTL